MTFLVLFITFCTFLDTYLVHANWWPDSKNVLYSFLKKYILTTYIQELHYLKVVKKDLKIPALQNL